MSDLSSAAYPRADVLRIVGISERQLRAWEKQELAAVSDQYSFPEILALKSLKKLRAKSIPASKIRLAMDALRRHFNQTGPDHPLTRFRVTAEGRKITVQTASGRMDAVSGQLLLDFDAKEIENLTTIPKLAAERAAREEAEKRDNDRRFAEHWFQKGLELEETGAPPEDAEAAYHQAIALNPEAAGALVNLGTIAFRRRRMREAEQYYSRAVEADALYPLGHFNLGNLLEELGRFEGAEKHYLEAARLNPKYADAYFNLALLAERNGQLLQAAGHWQTYLKLDPTSTWSATARKQLAEIKRVLRSK